jgi:hypothetical protein
MVKTSKRCGLWRAHLPVIGKIRFRREGHLIKRGKRGKRGHRISHINTLFFKISFSCREEEREERRFVDFLSLGPPEILD